MSSSALETSTVAVQVGPILTAGATATFIGGSTNSGPLGPGLAISDLDGAAGLTGATVTISGGFLAGDTLNFTKTASPGFLQQRRADTDGYCNRGAISNRT